MGWFGMARGYAALYGLVRDTLHVNLPGLGRLLDRVEEDHQLLVQGLKLHFDHRVSRHYGRLLAGEWNEAGTHRFLRELLNRVPGTVAAVDVGAFLGELALEMARHPRVASVIAFEPRKHCAVACRQSAALNGFAHVVVVDAALGDSVGTRPLPHASRAPAGDAMEPPAEPGEHVRVSTLDREVTPRGGPTVVRIAGEGAQLQVLRGARNFLARVRPLIIFDHDSRTRRQFRLDELHHLLGEGYAIHRLRRDGSLDGHLRRTRKCVAVPAESPFTAAARALQIG